MSGKNLVSENCLLLTLSGARLVFSRLLQVTVIILGQWSSCLQQLMLGNAELMSLPVSLSQYCTILQRHRFFRGGDFSAVFTSADKTCRRSR